MTFGLTLDVTRWEAHLDSYHAAVPGVVPVIKGNGYGFGRERLARQCHRLGVDTVAVGLRDEVHEVRRFHGGDVLVMAPLQPGEFETRSACDDPRVVNTVSRLDVLAEVVAGGGSRFVVEMDSPMHRHGISWKRLDGLAQTLRHVDYAGIALHLPLNGACLSSARWALHRLREAGVEPTTLWVSHLDGDDLARMQAESGRVTIRPRIGTAMWLGDRGAFTASGTILDVHPVRRGEPVGYRQLHARASGWIVVISGGTSHGVGLRTMTAGSGPRARLRSLAAELLQSAGRAPSPFRWADHRLRFADAPHMHVSMLLAPSRMGQPEVGRRLDCDVRMTLSTFDEVAEVGARATFD